MSLKQTSVKAHINQHGPSIGDELPWQPRHNHQTYGNVQGFDPRRHGFQDGMTTVVYYTDECDATEVVDRWLDENQDYVEKASKIGLHFKICDYGEDFQQASKDRLGPFADEVNNSGSPEHEACPMCGTEIECSLPQHFRYGECDD